MKKSQFFLNLILFFVASSCAQLSVKQQNQASPITPIAGAPQMNVKKYFDGNLEASAILQNQDGKIIGSYVAKMNARWDDNKGTVQQVFNYNDLSKVSRTLLLTLNDDGSFDVIGHDMNSPGQGKQQGNAMQMVYNLNLLQDGKKANYDFEDNFYLVDDKTIMVVSSKKLLGNVVGKSYVSIRKVVGNVDLPAKSDAMPVLGKIEKKVERNGVANDGEKN